MPEWNVTWRDGYVEGFGVAANDDELLQGIRRILKTEKPVEIKVVRR